MINNFLCNHEPSSKYKTEGGTIECSQCQAEKLIDVCSKIKSKEISYTKEEHKIIMELLK
jgi:hypothetical protein